MAIDCPVAGGVGGLAQEDPQPAKCSWHATSPPADSSPAPPYLLPFPRRTHNFNPVSRKASAWAHLMPRMKNGARKPPGDALPAAVPVGYRGFMPTTRLSRGWWHALPYFPNTSCCHLHTGHVKRQHLHPVPFCSVPLNWPV